AAEQLALQQPGVGIRHRQAPDTSSELTPGGHREDREAAVEPPGDHGAIRELPAETRRDGDASLAVDRVTVLTGEHRSRSLLTSHGGGWTDQPGDDSSPAGPCPLGGWFPTFHHFAPLPGIIAWSGGASMGKSHASRAAVAAGSVSGADTAWRPSPPGAPARPAPRPGRRRRPGRAQP